MDGNPYVYWIIDISVTRHITSNLSNFTSYSYVSPINMTLPNSSTILNNIAETFYLSNSLSLTHVYYIHTFNVNLISATKLIDSSPYHLTFTNTQCPILQKNSRNLIGLVDRHKNLYQVIPSAPSFTCYFIQLLLSNLLHRQLGHPSDSVHKTLSSIFSRITQIK